MNPYIGKKCVCRVMELEYRYIYLDPAPEPLRSPPEDWIPCLRSEAPVELDLGDELEVFVYLDTLDEPLATTRMPKVFPGQAGYLQIIDAAPFGYFADWGLSRDLLIPFKEGPSNMEVGRSYAITPYLDATGRLAGSTRLHERLTPGNYQPGQSIQGVIWRREADVGTFVILEQAHLALLPAAEPERFRPGDSATFRVSRVLPDGKVEVSARALAHQTLKTDADVLLSFLRLPGATELGDYSDPEQLRELLGLSKKAVKRAAGVLQHSGQIQIDAHGTYRTVSEALNTSVPSGKAASKPVGKHVPRLQAPGKLEAPGRAQSERHERLDRGQAPPPPPESRGNRSDGPSRSPSVFIDDGWDVAPPPSPSRAPLERPMRRGPHAGGGERTGQARARVQAPVAPQEPAVPEPPPEKRPPRREFVPDPPRPRKRNA